MVRTANANSALVRVIGDLITFIFSLILTLAVRYGEVPSRSLLAAHVPSFSILFVLFLIVGFGAGLYNKESSYTRRSIQGLLIRVQIINIFIGIAFFYLAPVTIAPKANLVIYFVISTALLFLWRLVMFPVLSATRLQSAVMVGKGKDVDDLYAEINANPRYGLSLKEQVLTDDSMEETVEQIKTAVASSGASVIVADLHDSVVESVMRFLYSLIFSGASVVDAGKLYEVVFDRVPLSMVGDRWLVENSGSSLGSRRIYDTLKRAMDIVISLILGVISLLFYPFVWAAVRIEDGGPLFIVQNRIGRNGKAIKIIKFRSMTADDGGRYENSGKSGLKVTKVGRFIRMTRIDSCRSSGMSCEATSRSSVPARNCPPSSRSMRRAYRITACAT